MSRMRSTLVAVLVLAAVIGGWTIWDYLTIDRCLDQGGMWLVEGGCVTR